MRKIKGFLLWKSLACRVDAAEDFGYTNGICAKHGCFATEGPQSSEMHVMAKAAKATGKATKPAKIASSNKARTKGELFKLLAEHTGLQRKQVADVFDTLGKIMSVDLAKPTASKPNVFVVPGMMKVNAIYKPATKSTTKPNPFKPGEMMEVKAKPARTVLKIRPLKALKAMV
jgi:hypothetical protein